MARNLIGSDETGLSDAFARIIINDNVITTKVINETLSPKWDETLVLECMTFFFSEDVLKLHPPVVVVEVFDEDNVVRHTLHVAVQPYIHNYPYTDSLTSRLE